MPIMGARLGTTRCGHTLPEVLLAVSLLALLTTMAVTTFADWRAQRRLLDTAEGYRQHLQWARQQAMARQLPAHLHLGQSAEGSCYRFVLGDPPACGCMTLNCAIPGTTLALQRLPSDSGLRVAPVGSATHVLIDPALGTLQPTISVVFSLVGGRAIRHITNLTGRTRSCTPGEPWQGFVAC